MIIEHPPEDHLVTCSAATTLGLLRAHCETRDHELPLVGSDEQSIGALLDAGGELPRHARWGLVRDVPVEVRFRRHDGTQCRAGAPLHKSVAGYDLGKLFVGSNGLLGSITQVTLRTVARSEQVWQGIAACDDAERAAQLALTLRANVPQLDALFCTTIDACTSVGVVLAGDADEVATLRTRCLAHASFEEGGAPSLPMRALSVRASATVTTSARLFGTTSHAAFVDLLFGGIELEADPTDPTRWLTALRSEVAEERGHVHVRRAPVSLALDVWGPLDPDTAALHARLEQAFR